MSSTSCLRRSFSPTPLLHLRPPSSRDHRRFTPHTAPPSCACESWSKAWPPMIFCVLIVDSPPDYCQGSVAIQPLKHSREQPTSSSGSPIFLLLHPNGRALRCPLTYIHTYIHTVAKSCPILATPWTVSRQAPLSIAFSRQEYWSGLPFPSPGDLPHPVIKPESPALQAGSLPLS